MSDLEEYDSDELIAELEDRGYYVYEDDMETEEDMEKRIEGEVEDRYERDYIALKRDFARYELRDHLCNIVERGSYISDDELFQLLKDKLKW